MKILDRLPISDQPTLLFWGPEPVTIKRYQLAVWVSFNDSPRPFPALIDTGHSHNFSITESQLRKFAGLSPDGLKVMKKEKDTQSRRLEETCRILRIP